LDQLILHRASVSAEDTPAPYRLQPAQNRCIHKFIFQRNMIRSAAKCGQRRLVVPLSGDLVPRQPRRDCPVPAQK
jgi:hypothetical protein